MVQFEVHVRHPKTEREEQFASMKGLFTSLASAIINAEGHNKDCLGNCNVNILVIPSMLSYKGAYYITIAEAKTLLKTEEFR